MTQNEFKNLVAFIILMEYRKEGVMGKSPSYIIEKFHRYVNRNGDDYNWGLDMINAGKLEKYLKKWGEHIERIPNEN